MIRAQSHVVGVALLLGVTLVAVGGVTATISELVASDTAALDAGRVASDLDHAIRPVVVTGTHTGTVSFLDGRLETMHRTVRVVNASGVVRSYAAGGVVYRSETTRVAVVLGAVVRGQPGRASVVTRPPIAVGGGGVAVGVPIVGNVWSVSGDDGLTVGLASRVTHERETLTTGAWRLAVETATPAAWERRFADRGASTTRRDFDDDGVVSVVARFPGDRRLTVVVHRLRLEVVTRGA